MSSRLHTLLWLGFLAAITLCAATNWQSALVSDTTTHITITGFGAFPAIRLALGFNVLAIFTARYARGFIRAALLAVVAAITALALFAAAQAPFEEKPILTQLVETATGVAGWEEQKLQVLEQVDSYSLTAFCFSALSAMLVIWICAGVFTKTNESVTAKPTHAADLWVN